MTKPRTISLISIIGMLTVFYYYYYSTSSPQVIAIIIKSPVLIYKIIKMNDRDPSYSLATFDGRAPYADGDRAQASVVKHLRLVESCRKDPSLIVVDVGAYLGDFGLYAAACGCRVYLFEVQPNMIDLIQTSIAVNNFSASRVHIINRAVNDLPSNSQLTFNVNGGDTTAVNGSLPVSTIRLDDVKWPSNSTILLLKIDVEGFELNVLRSAEKLFRKKRIQHLIFEYTAYWNDRAAQMDLLPYVIDNLAAKMLYTLDRMDKDVYGPLDQEMIDNFHQRHIERRMQTDIYATFVNSNIAIKALPYDLISSFA